MYSQSKLIEGSPTALRASDVEADGRGSHRSHGSGKKERPLSQRRLRSTADALKRSQTQPTLPTVDVYASLTRPARLSHDDLITVARGQPVANSQPATVDQAIDFTQELDAVRAVNAELKRQKESAVVMADKYKDDLAAALSSGKAARSEEHGALGHFWLAFSHLLLGFRELGRCGLGRAR